MGIDSKPCFTCKKRKFLFLFRKDNSKYKLKSNKGRCIECRKCAIKRSIRNKGYLTRINGKFEFVKASNFQIIKHFLS